MAASLVHPDDCHACISWGILAPEPVWTASRELGGYAGREWLSEAVTKDVDLLFCQIQLANLRV
jgi:hypothetical protein